MSKKSHKIAALIENCRGHETPAHYLGYFECFNREQFYEAHDVLEELWLSQRNGPNYSFYKGLIQFAGAFVHLQKHSLRYPRLRPSAALFNLAANNLKKYPTVHERLDITHVLGLIQTWLGHLESAKFESNPLHANPVPRLQLIPVSTEVKQANDAD